MYYIKWNMIILDLRLNSSHFKHKLTIIPTLTISWNLIFDIVSIHLNVIPEKGQLLLG
jgi:hypothetical protein